MTYKGLILTFPYPLLSVERVEMTTGFGIHACFKIWGVILEEEAETWLFQVTEETTLLV